MFRMRPPSPPCDCVLERCGLRIPTLASDLLRAPPPLSDTSVGETTCNNKGEGPPGVHSWPRHGSYGYYKEDTETFAAWKVDYVKVDWCGGKEGHSAEELHR